MSSVTTLFDQLRKYRSRNEYFAEYFRSFTSLFVSSVEKYSSEFGIQLARAANGAATTNFNYLGKKFEFFQLTDFTEDKLGVVLCMHTRTLAGEDVLKEAIRFAIDHQHAYLDGKAVGDLIGLVDLNEFSMKLLNACALALKSEFKL